MPYLLIRHKVKDYATWRPIFDAHAPARATAGSLGGVLFQSSDDPNEVVVLFEWDSPENARAFAGLQELRETMERAGVTGTPEIVFLEQTKRLAR